VSTRTSVAAKGQSGVPRSERDAAPLCSIQIGSESYNRDEALKASLVVLECLCQEMLSPEAMFMAFHRARARMPQHAELIEALHDRACQIRKGNFMSGMF
jgi:hypothetical protein